MWQKKYSSEIQNIGGCHVKLQRHMQEQRWLPNKEYLSDHRYEGNNLKSNSKWYIWEETSMSSRQGIHMWSWKTNMAAKDVSLLSALSHSLTQLAAYLLTLHPQFRTFILWISIWYVGSRLKNQTKTQEVMTQYLEIFLDFCSWQLSKIYKRITKEKRHPKGPYAINTCLTKLLSRQTESLHMLKLHWP